MRFPLRQVTNAQRCVTQLDRGEVRRLPLDVSHRALGWYIGCPACGMLNVVSVLDAGQHIREDVTLIDLEPGTTCSACGRCIRVKDGAFELADG